MPEIKERIKEMRIRRGLTLLEVAERIGVKEATVQRYESGSIKNIKHETICKLAEVFACDPGYLMGWSMDSSNNPTASNISNSAIVQGNNATTLIVRNGSIIERELCEEELELLRIYELLNVKNRHTLLAEAFRLEEIQQSHE